MINTFLRFGLIFIINFFVNRTKVEQLTLTLIIKCDFKFLLRIEKGLVNRDIPKDYIAGIYQYTPAIIYL